MKKHKIFIVPGDDTGKCNKELFLIKEKIDQWDPFEGILPMKHQDAVDVLDEEDLIHTYKEDIRQITVSDTVLLMRDYRFTNFGRIAEQLCSQLKIPTLLLDVQNDGDKLKEFLQLKRNHSK